MGSGKIIKRAVFFDDDVIVALRFDVEEKIISIIGTKHQKRQIDYLVYKIYKRTRTIKNSSKNIRKIKITFKSIEKDFYKGIDEIKKTMTVQEVKKFGRLIR